MEENKIRTYIEQLEADNLAKIEAIDELAPELPKDIDREVFKKDNANYIGKELREALKFLQKDKEITEIERLLLGRKLQEQIVSYLTQIMNLAYFDKVSKGMTFGEYVEFFNQGTELLKEETHKRNAEEYKDTERKLKVGNKFHEILGIPYEQAPQLEQRLAILKEQKNV